MRIHAPLMPAADPRIVGAAMSDAAMLCTLTTRRPRPPRR